MLPKTSGIPSRERLRQDTPRGIYSITQYIPLGVLLSIQVKMGTRPHAFFPCSQVSLDKFFSVQITVFSEVSKVIFSFFQEVTTIIPGVKGIQRYFL